MDTFLFDLDGTLLPLDYEKFIEIYFAAVTKKFSFLGFSPKELIKAVWLATDAMIKNDGARLNSDVFWDTFSSVLGSDMRRYESEFESFYKNEFSAVKCAAYPDPLANKCVKELKRRGYTVALATNPIFPAVATDERIKWAGLDKDDFALITTFENSHYCKPNPKYFFEVLNRLGKSPSDCMMVGNDVKEDGSSVRAGIPFFLLEGYVIESEGFTADGLMRGYFEDLKRFIDNLPVIGKGENT